MMRALPFLPTTPKPIRQCKGVFLRCVINNFVSDTRIGLHTEFRMLKRRSCSEECDPGNGFQCERTFVFESLGEWGLDDILITDGQVFKNNAIYKVKTRSIDEHEFELYLEKVDE